jgi:hypothetical protein
MKFKKSSIIKPACNYLIVIGLSAITSTFEIHAEGNLVINTTFPFDTSISILCQTSGNESCPVTISRYSTVIYFKCPPGIAYCPENDYCDFLLQKDPPDSTSHLIQTAIDDYCQPHNTFHYENIQYITKIDSLNLFMEVDSINDSNVSNAVEAPRKTIFIKFDTTSFISKTAVIPVSKNNRSLNKSGIIQSSKIQYFDILGRILPSNVFNGNQGLFADKLIITNNRQIFFKSK